MQHDQGFDPAIVKTTCWLHLGTQSKCASRWEMIHWVFYVCFNGDRGNEMVGFKIHSASFMIHSWVISIIRLCMSTFHELHLPSWLLEAFCCSWFVCSTCWYLWQNWRPRLSHDRNTKTMFFWRKLGRPRYHRDIFHIISWRCPIQPIPAWFTITPQPSWPSSLSSPGVFGLEHPMEQIV